MEKCYNLNQVADLLGIQIRTARYWVSKGIIRAEKIEGTNRWFVRESEVRRLRNENEN